MTGKASTKRLYSFHLKTQQWIFRSRIVVQHTRSATTGFILVLNPSLYLKTQKLKFSIFLFYFPFLQRDEPKTSELNEKHPLIPVGFGSGPVLLSSLYQVISIETAEDSSENPAG
ncbi:unnamed protein product [Natator depressus]